MLSELIPKLRIHCCVPSALSLFKKKSFRELSLLSMTPIHTISPVSSSTASPLSAYFVVSGVLHCQSTSKSLLNFKMKALLLVLVGVVDWPVRMIPPSLVLIPLNE